MSVKDEGKKRYFSIDKAFPDAFGVHGKFDDGKNLWKAFLAWDDRIAAKLPNSITLLIHDIYKDYMSVFGTRKVPIYRSVVVVDEEDERSPYLELTIRDPSVPLIESQERTFVFCNLTKMSIRAWRTIPVKLF